MSRIKVTRIESGYNEIDPEQCFTCSASVKTPAAPVELVYVLGHALVNIRTCSVCAAALTSDPPDATIDARTAELVCGRCPDVISQMLLGRFA
jgi:hypothetical protein